MADRAFKERSHSRLLYAARGLTLIIIIRDVHFYDIPLSSKRMYLR